MFRNRTVDRLLRDHERELRARDAQIERLIDRMIYLSGKPIPSPTVTAHEDEVELLEPYYASPEQAPFEERFPLEAS